MAISCQADTNEILILFKGEKYWKDPDAFEPERFINQQNQIQTPEAFIPFGYGEPL